MIGPTSQAASDLDAISRLYLVVDIFVCPFSELLSNVQEGAEEG